MTSKLAYRPGPEDLELARLQIALEDRRQLLSSLEEERADLELALTQFAGQVKSRVGILKDEIRMYRTKLEEIRQLVQRLKADPDAAPRDVERSVAEEMAEEPEPDPITGFRARPEGGPGDVFGTRPSTSSQSMREVLRIYRLLAKRHHPDLATSPAERERRTELMLRINIAFRDHNLAVLQALLLEVTMDVPVAAMELVRQRLAWTRHETSRLDKELRMVQHRLDALRMSETHALWRAELAGEAALDDLERRTRDRLQRERARLDEASSQYARMAARRQVLLRRSASRVEARMAQASD